MTADDSIQQELRTLRRVQEALREVAAAVSAGRGQEFFNDFTALMGRVLGADCVRISVRAEGRPGQLRPIAAWREGRFVSMDPYDSAGTPCERVAGNGPSVFPAGVRKLFPADALLAEIGAEAYAGAPLADGRGSTIGNIAVLYRRPLEEAELVADLIRIFAARVGGELERLEALRASEEEREFLELQVRHAQKMEAIGTLAGGVAHDFNNVLAGILGNVEVASLKLEPGHPVQPHLDEVQKAVRRARNLVNQLLTFSRRSNESREATSPAAVLDEALQLLRPAVPKNVEIRSMVATDLPDIVADGTRLHQVLMNLGTNAAYALKPAGGVIEFVLDVVTEPSATADAPVLPSGRCLRLVVRDNGPGMDAAIRDRIFEPFFTTKPPGEGSGLGLSVVHGIVKSHGGSIRVSTAPGEGASFEVLLPIGEAVTTPAGGGAPARAATGRGRLVLVVDDETAVGLAARHVLEHLGFAVVLHRNPLEAFSDFQNDPARFSLLLTDLSMPEQTGVDLIQQVRRLAPDLPAVLMTGYSRGVETQAALGLPRMAILEKPFTLAVLAGTLGELLPEDS